ncbi:RNA polymerase [Belerina virus]|uniref:RNA-directed RNA polymerase L n=1 Tax=Belerina virus TaxID=2748342 RepID=A0A7D5DP48_9MONO|nr:RNA polymerase [Belerina virus]QKZ93219.1 RNA polymerase [Belerina virus]
MDQTPKVSDILYPECHLDSPIVTGKLVELLNYTGLPFTDTLKDKTLIRNLKINEDNCRGNNIQYTQRKYGKIIVDLVGNPSKLRHVPYPSGNLMLFNMRDDDVTLEISSHLRYASLCYKKISRKIIQLRRQTEYTLGRSKGIPSPEVETEEHMMSCVSEVMQASKWYHPFMFWFTLKYEMRKILKNTAPGNQAVHQNVKIIDTDRHIIVINRNLCTIIQREGWATHYLTHELVLLYCDVAEGRLMIDSGMTLDPRYRQLKVCGNLLWDFIDSQFAMLGNSTYDLVAMVEPLVLGYLQLNDSSTFLRGAFLDYCLHDLINIYVENGYDNPEDHDRILNIIDHIFSIDDIHMVSEFFSFFRTFGHPTLEAENAADKVRAHMNKPKLIKFSTMMKAHALFCGTIINGYRDRHGGMWPPLTLGDHASSKIKQCMRNHESLTHELCIENWKSFCGIKFGCFMGLSLDEDLTMYMKDKALSAIKQEWDSVYPRSVMIYDAPQQSTSRRLVEVFLEDNTFDPVNLINYVISGDYLNDPDFNVSYSLKEKEIKQVGRLFAKMTYKMRACQVVAESLIANGVGSYFRENGMSKNEHELLKTLHKLSASGVPRDLKHGHEPKKGTHRRRVKKDVKQAIHSSNSEQYETVSTFLTTDLQKFCLNWRQETTNIFAERLNEIYGLPGFFNWQHKRLEQSILYVADPHCPPNVPNHIDLEHTVNSQIFIHYPMGGIEGYSQKLWTIITIPFLFLSAYEAGVKIAAVVQGDNQAIAITKRVHPNLPYTLKKNMSANAAKEYFYILRRNLGDIGHNLKANETIISSNFFIYSKRIYYDGLVLSQALKPLSRCVFWSETIVDETRSACSNICTSIAKSIEQGYSRWLGFAIAVLKTIQQLIISLKYTINDSMTPDIVQPIYRNPSWILSAALIPAQIGGFNYINLSRLFVRNIGDPVTSSFADLKRYIQSGIISPSILQKIMKQECGSSTFLDWASDPYSVNIPHSQSIITMLKNVTSRTILQNSVNPMLRGLFHFDFQQEDHDLADFLMDRPIIIPRAAHEIMDKSLTGARQEIAGMLDSTKGLIRNSLKTGGLRKSFINRLTLYDYEQFRVFNKLMKVEGFDPLISTDACSVELAISLRKRMWKDLTHGRPIYGLEVPDAIEVVQGYYIQNCEDCYFCSAGQMEYGWFFCPAQCELDKVSHESNSIRVPYFGSSTEERSEIKLSNVKNPSRALKSAIRIATVYTWAYGDSDPQWEEAWYLASFRANVTLDELKAITPISTSNNIAHRLRDKSTQMKYASTSLNRVGRYVTISNDKLNFTVEDRKIDTNLIYQQIMLIGLSILEEHFRYTSMTDEYNTVLHLHINKHCCLKEMCDHPYVDTEKTMPTLRRVETNKLIYDPDPIIESNKNTIQQQVFRKGMLDFPVWPLRNLNTALAQSLAGTIIEIISKENRDHLNEFKTLENDDDINSMITEFLLVEPDEFVLYLGMYTAINWAFDIYYRRPEGKYQMTEYLQAILITASHSITKVISNALSHPRVFQRFWDSGLIEPIYGPNVQNQDYNRITQELICGAYQLYLNFWLSDEEVEYLITEGEEELVDQRFELVQSRHLCVLSSLYIRRQDMPQIRGLTSIEKCTVLTDRLEKMRFSQGVSADWHIDPLPVTVYPASMTYIRRGTIKHIRLRNYLSGESEIMESIKIQNQEIRVFDMPTGVVLTGEHESYYFPATLLFSLDFQQSQDNIFDKNITNKWENHVTRRVGINSTSCYKALELATFLNGKVAASEPRLFLGEGSGAMMVTYYYILGQSRSYYNTGVFDSDIVGQRVLSLVPSEAMMVAKNNPTELAFESDLITLFNGKPESTWIGSLASFTYIMEQIPPHSVGFIHNDMESSFDKDPCLIMQEQVHSLALAINLGNDYSYYICKLAPRPNDYTPQLLYLLLNCYEEVSIFIPSSSNPQSSEIYLISSCPRHKCLLTPDMLMRKVSMKVSLQSDRIHNTVMNYKIKHHLELIKKRKNYGDYAKSDLKALTKPEKLLLSVGFSVNGPKLVKALTGHDVASGQDILRSSITSLIIDTINEYDLERSHTPFFDPYPIRRSSKHRERMQIVCRKIVAYFILYSPPVHSEVRREIIKSLRKKLLIIDLKDNSCKIFMYKKLREKYARTGLSHNVLIQLETSEVKIWWKILGYSLMTNQDNES